MAEKAYKRTAPFITAAENVSGIMLDVLIALLPAVAWAVYMFGLSSLKVLGVSVAACVASDMIMSLIFRRRLGITDLSAVVSGVILGLTLPYDVPLLLPAAGGAFGMIVIKGLSGGIGKNIFNPAISGRIFVAALWGEKLATDTYKNGMELLDTVNGGQLSPVPLVDMFIGNRDGAMGEISILLLCAGAAYLLMRRTVTWHTTAGYIGGAVAACLLLCEHYDTLRWTLSQLFAGGLVFCAVFAVNDMCTSPLSRGGKVIYGAVAGALGILFRVYLPYTEGVWIAILAANAIARLIDTLYVPRPFGKRMKIVPVAEKEAEKEAVSAEAAEENK